MKSNKHKNKFIAPAVLTIFLINVIPSVMEDLNTLAR